MENRFYYFSEKNQKNCFKGLEMDIYLFFNELIETNIMNIDLIWRLLNCLKLV